MPWPLTRISRLLDATMLIIYPKWRWESKNNILSIIWVGKPGLLWLMTILLTRKKIPEDQLLIDLSDQCEFFYQLWTGILSMVPRNSDLNYTRIIRAYLSSYFSSVAEFLSQYNSISPKTWNRSRGIRWYFVEQQTPTPIHLQICSWYRCQFTANLAKHVISIWGRSFQFRYPGI